MAIVRTSSLPARTVTVWVACLASDHYTVAVEANIEPGRDASPVVARAMEDAWLQLPRLQVAPGPFCVQVRVAARANPDDGAELLWQSGMQWDKLCGVFARKLTAARDLARTASVVLPEVAHHESTAAKRVEDDLAGFMARVDRIIEASQKGNP